MPKVAAIAWTTSKEAMSQPLFYVFLAIGVFGLILFPFVPYNTLGEDIKMVKDEGLTLIMVLSILLALWTASLSIAEEIEGRTALTLLSKPVGRREFIFGKFLGILMPVVIMFLVSARLSGQRVVQGGLRRPRDRPWPSRRWPTARWKCSMWPRSAVGLHGGGGADGHQRGDFHAAADAGQPDHLRVDLRVGPPGADPGQFGGGTERVRPLRGQPAGRHLPVLDHFNISAGISAGQNVPGEYLAWAGLYCLIYSTVAMLVALLLFEDRDLA